MAVASARLTNTILKRKWDQLCELEYNVQQFGQFKIRYGLHEQNDSRVNFLRVRLDLATGVETVKRVLCDF